MLLPGKKSTCSGEINTLPNEDHASKCRNARGSPGPKEKVLRGGPKGRSSSCCVGRGLGGGKGGDLREEVILRLRLKGRGELYQWKFRGKSCRETKQYGGFGEQDFTVEGRQRGRW